MKKLMIFFVTVVLTIGIARKAEAMCNHNWQVNQNFSSEATCEREGTIWYNCSICGDYKTEKIPATGIHEYTEWRDVGTHCKDGTMTRYCKNCFVDETIPRMGDGKHIWSEWSTLREEDCLNDGEKSRYCHECYTYEKETIPSNSQKHNWSIWLMNYSKDRTERKCYTCGKVQTIILSHKKKTIKVGKSFTLKLKKKTHGDKIVKYSSSNKKIATVNKKGKVLGKRKGTVKITVKTKNKCKAVCTVTVK